MTTPTIQRAREIENALLRHMSLHGGPEQFAEFFLDDPRGRTAELARVAAEVEGPTKTAYNDFGLFNY